MDTAYRYSESLLYIILRFTAIIEEQIKFLFSSIKNKVTQVQDVEN